MPKYAVFADYSIGFSTVIEAENEELAKERVLDFQPPDFIAENSIEELNTLIQLIGTNEIVVRDIFVQLLDIQKK